MDFFELFYRENVKKREKEKKGTYKYEVKQMLCMSICQWGKEGRDKKRPQERERGGTKGLFKVYLLRKKFPTTLMNEKRKKRRKNITWMKYQSWIQEVEDGLQAYITVSMGINQCRIT